MEDPLHTQAKGWKKLVKTNPSVVKDDLVLLYKKYGTLRKMAEAVGVHYNTLCNYLDRLGIDVYWLDKQSRTHQTIQAVVNRGEEQKYLHIDVVDQDVRANAATGWRPRGRKRNSQ